MLREKGGTLALQTIRGDKMILGPTKEAHDSISGHSQCNNWESSLLITPEFSIILVASWPDYIHISRGKEDAAHSRGCHTSKRREERMFFFFRPQLLSPVESRREGR
jgi:hypothetical protein